MDANKLHDSQPAPRRAALEAAHEELRAARSAELEAARAVSEAHAARTSAWKAWCEAKAAAEASSRAVVDIMESLDPWVKIAFERAANRIEERASAGDPDLSDASDLLWHTWALMDTAASALRARADRMCIQLLPEIS